MSKHPYEMGMSQAHEMGPRMDRLANSGFLNPAYRPHARQLWDEAVDEATVEEGDEDWTREKRAERRREIYDAKMAARDC